MRRCINNRPPLRKTVAAIGASAALLLGLSPAWAGTQGADCIRDAADFDQGSICTANDVRIGVYTRIGGPVECFDGEQVTVELRAEIESGPEKYDVGIWLDENGGNAQDRGNTCYRDYLNPVSAPAQNNADVSLSDGDGPYYNGEISDLNDTCGDVPSSSAWGTPADIMACSEGGGDCVYSVYDFTATFQCQDSDDDGTADVGTCTSWEVGVSPQSGAGDDGVCGDGFYDDVAVGAPELETVPSQSSKCNCSDVAIGGLTVLKTGTIEVIKDVQPDTPYTGDSFDLRIDGTVQKAAAQDGDTSGAVTVSAGTAANPGADHTVDEVAGVDTVLAHYDSSIACSCSNATPNDACTAGIDSTPGPSASVTVLPDDAWICTITNSLKLASVSVNKTVSGTVPGEGFTFEVREGASETDAGTVVVSGTTDAAGFTDFGGFQFIPGDYQLCETGMMVDWSNSLVGFTPLGATPEGGDNSTECVNFTIQPGDNNDVTFDVDNIPPPDGDEARTIGFWKNWTSCDGHGNQEAILDQTLDAAGGMILLGDFEVNNCLNAVSILDKRDIVTAKKSAGDAAYGLAAQLLAAKLNVVAEAGDCDGYVLELIDAADALLSGIEFDGTGMWLKGGKYAEDRDAALDLAGMLDDYNNNELCD